jgi:hypothetical protein
MVNVSTNIQYRERNENDKQWKWFVRNIKNLWTWKKIELLGELEYGQYSWLFEFDGVGRLPDVVS